jgi:hypothetical protein
MTAATAMIPQTPPGKEVVVVSVLVWLPVVVIVPCVVAP